MKRGVAVDEARRLILDQVAAKSDETRTFPHVSTPLGGRDERITRRDAVANALLHRYSPTLFQLEDAARQYRGMTLLELARESLTNGGGQYPRPVARRSGDPRAAFDLRFPRDPVGRHQQVPASGLRGLSQDLHAVLPPGAGHRLQGDAPGPARRSAAAS